MSQVTGYRKSSLLERLLRKQLQVLSACDGRGARPRMATTYRTARRRAALGHQGQLNFSPARWPPPSKSMAKTRASPTSRGPRRRCRRFRHHVSCGRAAVDGRRRCHPTPRLMGRGGDRHHVDVDFARTPGMRLFGTSRLSRHGDFTPLGEQRDLPRRASWAWEEEDRRRPGSQHARPARILASRALF